MKTYEFKDYLKRTFYHPSTNIEFPNGRLKAFSRHVISRLWDMQEFKVGDKTYSNDEIRYILSERMMPEHLDSAIKIFVRLNRKFGLEILMYLIILCVINEDGLMKLLAEYDLKYPNKNSKGGAAWIIYISNKTN